MLEVKLLEREADRYPHPHCALPLDGELLDREVQFTCLAICFKLIRP